MKLKVEESKIEYKFASWIKQVIDQACPKDLFFVGGRALGKTTDILAERTQEAVYDMPGAQFAIVADTYLNAQKNIVPGILEGWEKNGWIEGIHYVLDERPPSTWAKPVKPVHQFKHTISTWNGCHFNIVSMDRPSAGAGNSYQHLFGDETKYLIKKKIDKLIPAVRGEYVKFSHSPMYRGMTFTTDMPNPYHNEDDWILNMEKKMNQDQIIKILQVAQVLNDLRIELLNMQENGASKNAIAIKEAGIARWEKRWRKLRKNSCFYYVASSFVNADILSVDFFKDALSSLGSEEFATSVGSIKPTIEKGSRFYRALDAKHFYSDGLNYAHYDKFGLKDTLAETSKGLKYINHNDILEVGFDAGKQNSLVVGQPQGNKYRILKNLYTIPPNWYKEIGEEFVRFFEPHLNKTIHLYYDRAANNLKAVGKDYAAELKHAIEYNNGKPTGWYVKLMSRNQGIIPHQVEYDFMLQLMTGSNKHLPELCIDQYQCKELKSSLENAPVIVKKVGERSVIKKDKKSEQLPDHRLPMESTNFSDAFKYLMCRPAYLKLAENKLKQSVGSVGVR